MSVAETDGTWRRASAVAQPSDASLERQLKSVSCSGPVACVVVGSDGLGAIESPIIFAVSDGVFGPPQAVTLPADAATPARQASALTAVACDSPGSCTALGGYQATGGTGPSMAVTESNGVWGQAAALPPADAPVTFSSLSCQSAGNCVGVGTNFGGSTIAAIAATEVNGVWSAPFAVEAPADAARPYGVSEFNSVACPAAGSCVAVGLYADAKARGRLMLATQTGGTWTRARAVAMPRDAATPNQTTAQAELTGVGCVAAGNCLAVGFYMNRALDDVPVYASETNGRWSAARKLSLPANASKHGLDATEPTSVACTPTGGCVVVGRYVDRHGITQAFVAHTL
jgi:hypothetical protein